MHMFSLRAGCRTGNERHRANAGVSARDGARQQGAERVSYSPDCKCTASATAPSTTPRILSCQQAAAFQETEEARDHQWHTDCNDAEVCSLKLPAAEGGNEEAQAGCAHAGRRGVEVWRASDLSAVQSAEHVDEMSQRRGERGPARGFWVLDAVAGSRSP